MFRGKIGERLAVSKQVAQKSDVERFNLSKLTELEVGEMVLDEDNNFVDLENLIIVRI